MHILKDLMLFTRFLYKNKVYENIEPHFLTKVKKILYGIKLPIVLSLLTEPQKSLMFLKDNVKAAFSTSFLIAALTSILDSQQR